jgi:hypothetical protein
VWFQQRGSSRRPTHPLPTGHRQPIRHQYGMHEHQRHANTVVAHCIQPSSCGTVCVSCSCRSLVDVRAKNVTAAGTVNGPHTCTCQAHALRYRYMIQTLPHMTRSAPTTLVTYACTTPQSPLVLPSPQVARRCILANLRTDSPTNPRTY